MTAMQATRILCLRNEFGTGTELTIDVEVNHGKQEPILSFRIPHYTLCLPPQILHKPLFLNAPGRIAFSQEHLNSINYAKFGGQTECITRDSKIVNKQLPCTRVTAFSPV